MPQIDIPQKTYDALQNRAKEKGHKDAERYILFVLDEIVKKIPAPEKNIYSEEETEKVKERLKSLGYID